MVLEKLYRKDIRLILICAVVSIVSLYVGVRYFFQAFPESSIDFRTTRESSEPIAREFLSRLGLEPAGYRHAAIFDFDDDAKIFLEREVGVESSAKLLDTTIRLWRWEHRWFRPLQKEELQVEVTTKGEIVGFQHLIDENATGANLSDEQARRTIETFLTTSMGRSLGALSFVKGSAHTWPNRTDHTYIWKLRDIDIKGADYRLSVGLCGDRICSYEEFLEIPDAWERSYKNLRAWNTAASAIDAVFLLLTVVAMLVLLVVKIRGGDVRWGAAAILGAITFALQTLSALNSLPTELFAYDTTVSYPGFLLQRVVGAVLVGLVYGACIFLIAAAAEPLYRRRFPRFQSLTGLLSPRVFRTKEFFVSAMVGITLTFFFFAYENVFYIVANSLGAWAPREVAYSDLLSTAFPWIYVLFFGWFPAISEEFISRMFSIPFFESLLKSRVIAIVLAAFIWGFGHAEYPNQPFWIRGLEVGIAGIIFGVVMLRYGITAVVICHFSIDALYTAFVLIRSHNLYYVVTGGLSAGIFVVLFIAAAVAYFVKGGFRPPVLTNANDRTVPPASLSPPGSPDPFGTVRAAQTGSGAAAVPTVGDAAVTGEARDQVGGWRPGGPEATEAPGGSHTGPGSLVDVYRPMSGRRILAGLLIAAGFVAISRVPIPRYGEWADFKTTREQAKESAAVFLRGCGFDVSTFGGVTVPLDRTDSLAAAYLLETGGLDAVNATYRDLVPTPLWRTRFYVPGRHEEYAVSIEPRSGSAVGFERKLPDDAPGAFLSKDQARTLAERFASARGQDPAAGELKEQSEQDQKARRDHTLVWEYPIERGGEGKVRYELVVQGDTVGSWTRGVKVPEEWERQRNRQTVFFTVLRYIKVGFLGILSALAMVMLVQRIRDGAMPWKFAAVAGGIAAMATALAAVLGMGAAWANQYDTAMPEPVFLLLIWVGIAIFTVFLFLGAGVVGGLAASVYPQARVMLSRAGRLAYARDALIAGAVSYGFLLGLPALTRLLTWCLPSGRLISGLSVPASLGTSVPFLGVLAATTNRAILLPAMAAILAAVLARSFRTLPLRAILAASFVVSFLPLDARKPAELVFGAISSVILAGGAVALIHFFLRDNPLAWVWSAWFALGCLAACDLVGQSARFYAVSGAIALICILAPGLWLLKDAMVGGSRAARGPVTAP